jgi:hypothetical protein
MGLWKAGAAGVVMTALVAPSMAQAADAAIPEPRLGLFATREDIARARLRTQTEPWAKAYRARVLEIADAWAARSDAWIRKIMPPPGARFAYGTAGCPHCGKSWGNFGKTVADLDRPLRLECPHCRTVFDLENPSGPYADTGEGITVNGQRFWPRGVWNGFVVNQMWSAFEPENAAIKNLADAYSLTGDARYAHKAVVIMDALATLSPHTNGPRDFVPDPNTDQGRLQHLTSIFFRADVPFARALDQLGSFPALFTPSPTNPGKSVWENIRYGIFEEYLFKPIDTRNGNLTTLHNHEADSVRALLLVGLLYGNADYLRWGAGGLEAFLDNVIDRDGLYYETSLSYTEFTRSVYVDMAEMLARYDPARYPAEARMPRRADLPYRGVLFDHASFARLVLDTPERVSLLGRQPTFGNNHVDTTLWTDPGRPFSRPEFDQALRILMYSGSPQRRTQAGNKAFAMLPYAGIKPGAAAWWNLFRAPDAAAIRSVAVAEAPPAIPEPQTSDLFGQTGLVVLRGGRDGNRRGAVLRAGMNMPHAHDDQLGLLLFGEGRALSGDIGYGIFGNHVHVGWATRAIAHNTVVVNQDETSNDKLFRLGPGGTVRAFHEAPGVRLVEASLTPMFPKSDGVRDYRRTVLQIDLSDTAGYWLDLFDVEGGRVHDYAVHMRPLGAGGSFSFTDVAPQSVVGAWTLAGLDPQFTGAAFDQPGRSWGERLTVGGRVAPVPGFPDEVPEKGTWYAPPGNGYGFLHHVRRQETASPWAATWRWKDGGGPYGLRLSVLPEAPQQVISALGPTLSGTDRMQFVVARHGTPGTGRGSIRSRYTAVMESFGADGPQVTAAEAIRQKNRTVGVRVRAAAQDREDLILDARRGAVTVSGVPALGNGIGIVRRRAGQVESLLLTGGKALSAEGIGLRFATGVWTAAIAATDDEAGTFRISKPLPISAVGALLTVNSPAYFHGSAYRIGALTPSGDVTPLNSGLTLGRSRVAEAQAGGFLASAPLVYGFEYGTDTRFLTGKRIVSGGQTGHVKSMTDFKAVQTTGLVPKPGEPFAVYDVQIGDEVRMDAAASLTRESDGAWALRSNLPVTVTFPWRVERIGSSVGRFSEQGAAIRVSAEDLAADGSVRFRQAPDSPKASK